MNSLKREMVINMTSSPKVIFNCKFTHSFNRKEENYTNKQKENIKRKIKGKFDYFSNEEKRIMNLFEYYTGNINKEHKVNLILEDGSYASKSEIENRKKNFIKYIEKSNLWQGVISFNNDYINENITIEDLQKELVKNVFPRFFKKMGFKDIKNMAYNFSLHNDTDNLHFHFSFIEKKPNYVYFNGKVNYRRKGELSQEEIDFMKNEVALAVERNQFLNPMLTITNNEIENLKKYFNPKEKNFILNDKEDLILEDKILRVGRLLYQTRENNFKKIKYNSITNEEIKKLTKEIKRYLFVSKGEFYDDYVTFKNNLNSINDYIYKISEDNNISKVNIDTSMTKNKDKYLDNYILNSIVNHADYFYKSKSKKYGILDEDEILKELFLREYKKNKKQTRYNILENYLSNTVPQKQFQNKYKIRNAVRTINSEMEEAQKEFSKLFQPDNSYSK